MLSDRPGNRSVSSFRPAETSGKKTLLRNAFWSTKEAGGLWDVNATPAAVQPAWE